MFSPLVDLDYDTSFVEEETTSVFKKVLFVPCETTLFKTVHIDVRKSEMIAGSF